MSQLDLFIQANRADMLSDLKRIVIYCKHDMLADLDLYSGSIPEGGDERDVSIDVRLCIDSDRLSDEPEMPTDWCFRTGDSSYDQRHATWCAALSIGLDTDASELLGELINQLEDME